MVIKMKLSHKIVFFYLFIILVGLVFLPSVALAQVDTTNMGMISKVGPGEVLPVSIKLSNFGSSDKVDVLVKYSILSPVGNEIYSNSETVAVETTASFIKMIPISSDTLPGIYTTNISATYPGQVSPATSQFSFTVERKIFGVFQNNFLLYGGLIVFAVVLIILLGYFLFKRRASRFTPFDYSNIPHNQRTFYEILSDTIMQMRERIGDDALIIAANINGFKINEEGRVLAITEPPEKIIAALMTEYEKRLGEKFNFTARR
jgi:hypothetical protein